MYLPREGRSWAWLCYYMSGMLGARLSQAFGAYLLEERFCLVKLRTF
jgi:hypothetical protein